MASPWVFALKIATSLLTDSQTGCVKLIATISGTVIFFKQLAKLYREFSVHLKHQTATRLPITEAMKEVGNLKRFLEGTCSTVQELKEIKAWVFFQFPSKSRGVVYILRIKAYSDKT